MGVEAGSDEEKAAVAAYLVTMLADLTAIAKGKHLEALRYLLQMAEIEARTLRGKKAFPEVCVAGALLPQRLP